MIFYFSGTGNSLYVAKSITKENKEELVSITAMLKDDKPSYEYNLKDNEVVGFIYPIYAWAPPKQVLQFIEKLKFNNYKNNYIFTVATCGENIGKTIEVMGKALGKKSLTLNSGFSIKMPNNYIILGDVDSKEVEKKKLLEAESIIAEINNTIKSKANGVFKVEKGFMPGLLTNVINPLFSKGAANTKKFYSNDKCTGCGICEKVCNCSNINVQGRPIWGSNCTQCLACVHLCPTSAIQYGNGTIKKGRYKHPSINTNEMIIK
ncbi:EFR1 family ferrodoxin [Clostridium sp.]|uniref:EFR1 family ferrodoxin n=1 Tax=Clostridium sp. TaxID=1506 RepID=UPI002FCB0A42